MAEVDPSTGMPADHSTHEPELIAGLLDADQPPTDRSKAEALVAACSECAALHRDLLALASATAKLPAAPRSRDFSLSPEMAAALREAPRGEPTPAAARLTGDMTLPQTAHATHDRVLIANLLDRTPIDAERARAEAQMADCRECAMLHQDLLALSAATRSLTTPSRPRDFTLTVADAERLRVRSWRRVLAAIGSSRDVFSRPLAIGLTTLGIAGLLIGTIPTALPGFGGAATSLSSAEDAARNATDGGSGAAGANPEFLAQASGAPEAASAPAIAAAPPTSAPSAAPAPAALASPEPTPEVLVEGGEAGSSALDPQDQKAFDTYLNSFAPAEPAGPSPLVVLAGLLLLAGLGLFLLRWTARRLGDG